MRGKIKMGDREREGLNKHAPRAHDGLGLNVDIKKVKISRLGRD